MAAEQKEPAARTAATSPTRAMQVAPVDGASSSSDTGTVVAFEAAPAALATPPSPVTHTLDSQTPLTAVLTDPGSQPVREPAQDELVSVFEPSPPASPPESYLAPPTPDRPRHAPPSPPKDGTEGRDYSTLGSTVGVMRAGVMDAAAEGASMVRRRGAAVRGAAVKRLDALKLGGGVQDRRGGQAALTHTAGGWMRASGTVADMATLTSLALRRSRVQARRKELGLRSVTAYRGRRALAWLLHIAAALTCCIVSAVEGAAFDEWTARRAASSWLMAYVATLAIVEPAHVLALACLRCLLPESTPRGRCWRRCHGMCSDLFAP